MSTHAASSGTTPAAHTLGARFLSACRAAPTAAAVTWRARSGREELTREGLARLALAGAGWLAGRGLAPGGRVALCLGNGPGWAATFFAAQLAGCVVVPLDTQTGDADLDHELAVSGARAVVAAEPERFAGRGLLVVDAQDQGRADADLGEVLAHAPLDEALAGRGRSAADPAVLPFTSGTTGRPKGVTLTHANLLADLDMIAALNAVGAGDALLGALPLHHAYPLMLNLLVPVLLGARAVFLESLRPEEISACLKEEGVTVLLLTPRYVELFHRRVLDRLAALPLGLGRGLGALLRSSTRLAGRIGVDPLSPLRRALRRSIGPKFRFFLSGGARLDPDVARDMHALGAEVYEGYGLTETSPVATFNLPGAWKLGAAGRPLPGVELRVLSPEPDESGVAWGTVAIRGANVFAGYWDNPQATAEALRDGWLITGDIGRLDQDGYLFLRGRARDVVVLSSGKKFPAEEVEAVYAAEPAVREIAVLADAGGDRLAAVVVPDLEALARAGELDLRGAVRWHLERAGAALPEHRRVRSFVIARDELPRTRLGKLKRFEVEKIYARLRETGNGGPPEAPAGPELPADQARVLAVTARIAGRAHVRPDEHLELDLGLDSLGRIELASALEAELGRPVSEEALAQAATAGELAALVARGEERGEERSMPPAAGGDDRPRTPAVFQGEGEGGVLEAGGGVRAKPAESGLDWREVLARPVPEAVRRALWFSPSRPVRWLQRVLGELIARLTRLAFRLEIEGGAELPPGPLLVCPNHASFFDAFLVFAALPRAARDRLYFVGLARYFESWPLRPLVPFMRVIPLRDAGVVETLASSAAALRADKALCVFPEGARSVDGSLKPLRKGPAILAVELGVPVLPLALLGAEKTWSPAMRLPRLAKVSARLGQALSPGQLMEKGRARDKSLGDHEAALLGLRLALLELGVPEGQGGGTGGMGER